MSTQPGGGPPGARRPRWWVVRRWPLWEMPRRLVASILVVEAAAVGLVIAIAAHEPNPAVSQALLAAILTALAIVHTEVAIGVERVRRRVERRQPRRPQLGVDVRRALVLPPVLAALVAVVVSPICGGVVAASGPALPAASFSTATIVLACLAARRGRSPTGGQRLAAAGRRPAHPWALLRGPAGLHDGEQLPRRRRHRGEHAAARPGHGVRPLGRQRRWRSPPSPSARSPRWCSSINPWLSCSCCRRCWCCTVRCWCATWRRPRTPTARPGCSTPRRGTPRPSGRCAGAAGGRPARRAGARPRPLQGRQRHLRPPRRRPGARRGGRRTARRGPRPGPGRPVRRRGVRGDARRAGSGAGARELEAVAERIRRRVADLRVEIPTPDGPLTVAGLTRVDRRRRRPGRGQPTCARLLQIADTALYAAKRAGRNLVRMGVAAGPAPSPPASRRRHPTGEPPRSCRISTDRRRVTASVAR